jgi:hypothetical protein
VLGSVRAQDGAMASIALSLPRRAGHAAPSRWRAELGLFFAAYLVYLVGRWIAVGERGPALQHARQVIDLERGLGVASERSVQQALDGDVAMLLLSNIYLAAQFVVLPGVLIWLYHRAPAIYRRLRDTVLATGNHYYFDIAAGVLVSIAGFAVGRLPQRLAARLSRVPVGGRLQPQPA